MRSLSTLVLVSVLIGATFAAADERKQYNDIRQLLNKKQFDEAEELLASSLKESPESRQLKSLHYLFYSYLSRAGRNDDAIRHAEANLDMWLDNLSRLPQAASNFPRQVDLVTSGYQRIDKNGVAIQKLDEIVEKVNAIAVEKESP